MENTLLQLDEKSNLCVSILHNELNIKTCVTLWAMHGIGLFDQQMLLGGSAEQPGPISNISFNYPLMDDRLEDILDLIDLETAVHFLRKELIKNGGAGQNKGPSEKPQNLLSAPGLVFLESKKQLFTETQERSSILPSSRETCFNTLLLDYNLLPNLNKAVIESPLNLPPVVLAITLFNRSDAKEQTSQFQLPKV